MLGLLRLAGLVAFGAGVGVLAVQAWHWHATGEWQSRPLRWVLDIEPGTRVVGSRELQIVADRVLDAGAPFVMLAAGFVLVGLASLFGRARR